MPGPGPKDSPTTDCAVGSPRPAEPSAADGRLGSVLAALRFLRGKVIRVLGPAAGTPGRPISASGLRRLRRPRER
jgi:hypothetical protein